MNPKASLAAEFEHEAVSTRAMLKLVPADKLGWKPHAKSMSLGSLAGHIAEIPSWGPMTIAMPGLEFSTKDFKERVLASPAEILALFEKNLSDYLNLLAATADSELEKHWTLKVDGKLVVDQPRWEVLRGWVHNHFVHHRGQLSVYLRLLDIPLPSIYGPTADQPQFG